MKNHELWGLVHFPVKWEIMWGCTHRMQTPAALIHRPCHPWRDSVKREPINPALVRARLVRKRPSPERALPFPPPGPRAADCQSGASHNNSPSLDTSSVPGPAHSSPIWRGSSQPHSPSFTKEELRHPKPLTQGRGQCWNLVWVTPSRLSLKWALTGYRKVEEKVNGSLPFRPGLGWQASWISSSTSWRNQYRRTLKVEIWWHLEKMCKSQRHTQIHQRT